ncbi:MAG TPA: MaoC family dehydratase [Roseiflexaceae bacterium]|nr:MaoC family dehydratase [Roseiflexaceae bacterium]
MTARTFTLDELRGLVGQEIGLSDWLTVTQERIDLFADATGDHQWIHQDVERARRESPYRTTIAHGFLTLSLLTELVGGAIRIDGTRMALNYGLNRVRFPAPVPANAQIRARINLQSLEDIPGGVQTVLAVVVEVQGAEKPCCVAEWVTRRYV